MKYKIITLLVAIFSVVSLCAPVAYAATEGDAAEKTAFSFGSCWNKNVDIKCLAVEVLSFLSIGVGIAVVGGIAAGGVVYSTAEGNPGKAQKGITIIVNAVIGLVLYMLLFFIVNWLVPGGVLK